MLEKVEALGTLGQLSTRRLTSARSIKDRNGKTAIGISDNLSNKPSNRRKKVKERLVKYVHETTNGLALGRKI